MPSYYLFWLVLHARFLRFFLINQLGYRRIGRRPTIWFGRWLLASEMLTGGQVSAVKEVGDANDPSAVQFHYSCTLTMLWILFDSAQMQLEYLHFRSAYRWAFGGGVIPVTLGLIAFSSSLSMAF